MQQHDRHTLSGLFDVVNLLAAQADVLAVGRRHRGQSGYGEVDHNDHDGRDHQRPDTQSPDTPQFRVLLCSPASGRCSQLGHGASGPQSLEPGGDHRGHRLTDAIPARLLPGCWAMNNTAATASGTAAGSATAPNSKTHTPSTNSPANCLATSKARQVLPTPPTPVNVTNRCECTAASISETSVSRPIKLVM